MLSRDLLCMGGCCSTYLQEADSVVVKALRCVVEDALQSTLNDAAGSQNTLAQFHQALTDLHRRDIACVNHELKPVGVLKKA